MHPHVHPHACIAVCALQARIRGCSAAFGRTWQQSKEELRDVTRQAFQGYWGRVRAAGGAGKLRMIEAHRVRGRSGRGG